MHSCLSNSKLKELNTNGDGKSLAFNGFLNFVVYYLIIQRENSTFNILTFSQWGWEFSALFFSWDEISRYFLTTDNFMASFSSGAGVPRVIGALLDKGKQLKSQKTYLFKQLITFSQVFKKLLISTEINDLRISKSIRHDLSPDSFHGLVTFTFHW